MAAGALLPAGRAPVRRRATPLTGVRAAAPAFLAFVPALGIVVRAVVLANLINNLPAMPAVLLGVNIGPNLTYAGSLATLLWRRIVHQHEHGVDLGEFTRPGLLAVPGVRSPGRPTGCV
ncbi:hypothetical protein BIV25_07540 [Streptomyces sp. MUSC 14]|nr:hypothetical protein BIV25_07540 [Streptomyces sp. MUSC 14]